MADVKNRQFLTYCTGKIRCEKLSGFLQREGFTHVGQVCGTTCIADVVCELLVTTLRFSSFSHPYKLPL